MIFILLHLWFSQVRAAEPVLPIYVFELRPRVYQDENKKMHGDWFESFERLSKKSGIKFQYQFVSVPRIELLLSSNRPGCNLTLLKTKTREEKFNIDFIHLHEEKTIFKAYQRSDDTRTWNIKRLIDDKNAKITTNTSVAIEALEEKGIKNTDLLFNINSIIHMLMIKRVDLYVGSHLAIESTEEFKKGLIKPAFTLKTMLHGIGCSRATSPEIIEKLKAGTKGWKL